MSLLFLKRSGLLLGLLLGLAVFCQGAPSKLVPASLISQDGWHLSASYLPSQDGKKTVILVHDLGKSQKDFANFRTSLQKEGFGFLSFDLRGYGESTKEGVASKFSREGVDNQFNKMTYDVSAAINFLQQKGVAMENIVILGAGLGANIAAKSVSLWPDIPMLALISPTANTRDVLTIPAIRIYKGQILIAAGAADKKMFLEASVIRNVAYLNSEKFERDVTFLTAYDSTSHEMLDKYLIPSVMQWLRTPQKPAVMPDLVLPTDNQTDYSGGAIAPSNTEEALVPSVLN